jgi:multifunctional beta-oxidation protein
MLWWRVYEVKSIVLLDWVLVITDRGAATAANELPKRKADAVVEEKTTSTQAALYRLNGDNNPLHVRFFPRRPNLLVTTELFAQILPEFAAVGGFEK